MVQATDLAWQAILLGAFLAAAVPWGQGRPDETLVWTFATIPPLVLAVLLGVRERRARTA